MAASFPIDSKVILQNLVKEAQYNGMKGTVKSSPDPTTSRQHIHVPAANKSLAVKPVNLRHEPREVTSLSIDETRSLLLSFGKMETHEMTAIVRMEMAGEIGVATGVLQELVRRRISECPNDLAQSLAEIKAKEDAFAAKSIEARENGPSSWKEKLLHPTAYLKRRYKQNAKRDVKGEEENCCNNCGKDNIKLSKCGKCLSVYYCSKLCQTADHENHKKECEHLLKQRVAAASNDVDIMGNSVGGIGGVNVPRIGVALSESITGVHGEVICLMPCWVADDKGNEEIRDLDARRRNESLRNVTRSIRYFFKVYQSSVEAAKSLSLQDVGGMCTDAAILFCMKYPGVRMVDAEEARCALEEGTSEKFTLQFLTFKEKPDGWSIVGFDDRLAKILEGDWPSGSTEESSAVNRKKGMKKGKKKKKGKNRS